MFLYSEKLSLGSSSLSADPRILEEFGVSLKPENEEFLVSSKSKFGTALETFEASIGL